MPDEPTPSQGQGLHFSTWHEGRIADIEHWKAEHDGRINEMWRRRNEQDTPRIGEYSA